MAIHEMTSDLNKEFCTNYTYHVAEEIYRGKLCYYRGHQQNFLYKQIQSF